MGPLLLIWLILKNIVSAQEEEVIDIAASFNIDFIKTNGLTLLPGHVVNIAKNGSDLIVDVNTNCNIYSGLFTEKERLSHEYKYKRNSIRFNNANSSAENYFEYDNSISFFENQANAPYLPQASDAVVGVANTTITYSRIDEVKLPERAYYWEYEGAECARPDLVSFNSSYGYYISSIEYGTASHFDFGVNTDQLVAHIEANICSPAQERSFAYMAFPKPECILKNTVLKTIDPECESGCEDGANIDSCQENEIGGYLLADGYITFDDFRDNMIANVYNTSANDYTSQDIMNQWEGDLQIYQQVKCSQECGYDTDCVLICRTTEKTDPEFYRDLHAFLIGIGKIEDDHNVNILQSFRELLAENYAEIRNTYCVQTCYRDCALLRTKVKIDWDILISQYAHFAESSTTNLRVVAYPLPTTADFTKIDGLVDTLEQISSDEPDHRPLKMFLKKVPEIMIPGREDDFGPPSPNVGGVAVDFPDEENYLFNITLDNCQSGDCVRGTIKRHQEDLLRNDVPVTTEFTWIFQNRARKLENVYFARFGEELTIDPGFSIGVDFNAVDIFQLYLVFRVDANGGLMDRRLSRAWRRSIPKWKCLGRLAGNVVGIGGLHGGVSRGDYYYCQYMTPKGDGMIRMRTPVFQREFKGFIAYTTPSLSVEDINANTTDVNGNPLVFVNPLPAEAYNPWFTEVKINNVDVEFEESKLYNDIPVTSFTQGFSDEAFVMKLRRPKFNSNEFIKFAQPTIISENSTLSVTIDKPKLVAYMNYHYRIMLVSLTERTVQCPPGFKSMSPKAGILNLGYNYNWDSKFARGCKKKNRVHKRRDSYNEARRKITLTATSDWVVVFTVYGNLRRKYLETTADIALMRSTINHQVINQPALPFRSGKLRL